MQIVLIGAGRLATNLAVALHQVGHDIVAVYSRTMQSAQELAQRVGACPTDRIDKLPVRADAFILSVSDNALEDIARQVVKGREEQIFFHTAGSMSIDVLAHARHDGVFYPMQSFSKERLVDFSVIPLFVEGSDDQTLQTALALADSIKAKAYPLSSADRQYLHVAAVFACNFANHCYALSAEVLQRHGIDFRVMLPLIDETARKVHQLTPVEAQTGPAVRNDMNVVTHHLDLLSSTPWLATIYEEFSKDIQRTALTK